MNCEIDGGLWVEWVGWRQQKRYRRRVKAIKRALNGTYQQLT
jgi:hypothetical protein